MGRIRDAYRRLMGGTAPAIAADINRPLWPDLPAGHAAAPGEAMRLSDVALADAKSAYGRPLNPWTLPTPPPFVPAGAALAMDRAPGTADVYQWAANGLFSEGIGFLGYAYLAELSQRPEYRRVSEIFAAEATRKWIKLSGDPDRIDKLEAAMKRLGLRHAMRRVVELDGFFGRGQIFIDLGDERTSAELATPLVPAAKINPGAIKAFKIIEPFWSYPGLYDSINPMDVDFYKPKSWYIMSSTVHASRLITVTGREMPDMLKPAYSFGGLSLSQMIKPYVDNWLRTRQSVSDLLHSFSTMVLATDMSTILSGGTATNLLKRLQLFNQTRDNRGVMALNKETEELTNVSTPLGTLDKLQAQAQEQIASACGIPLVILLGVTPSGLNASSDGEVRSFYANVKSYQERTLRGPMHAILDLLQLDLDGKIDPEIGFEFHDLWEMSETDKASIRKTDADIDSIYVGVGVVDNEEVRDRITQDEGSPYFGMELAGNDELNAPPPPPIAPGDDPDDTNDPDGGKGGSGPRGAQDAWNEGDHPRASNGQFGEGAKSTITHAPKNMTEAGHFAVHKPVDGGSLAAYHVPTGKRVGSFSHLRVKTKKEVLAALNDVEKSLSPAELDALKSEEPTVVRALISAMHDKFPNGAFARDAMPAELADSVTITYNPLDLVGLAQDEQHWITVHPHGDDEGQPVLIEGSAGGGYTIIGGAGGALNGRNITPKSMSAARSDHKGASAAAHAATEHAEKHGTAEAHESAAAAHAIAKEANRKAGEHDKASEHGKAYARHMGEAAKASEPTKSELAEQATKHADTVDTAEAHREAGRAHMTASEFARDRGDMDAAEHHRQLQNSHAIAAERLETDATKAKGARLTAVAEAATAAAEKEKTAEAHRVAASAHSLIYNHLKDTGDTSGMSRVHAGAIWKHREMADKLEKREKKKELGKSLAESDEGKALAKSEARYKTGTAADIGTEIHEKFGLHLRNGSNAVREYKKAASEHSKRYYDMDPDERAASRARVNELAEKARAVHINARGLTQYDIDDGSAGAKAARKTLGHVVGALEHLERSGFKIKEALSRANVAYVPGSTGKNLGLAYQRNGVGHFTITANKIDPAYQAQQKIYAERRVAEGKPRWTVGADGSVEHAQQATVIHELAHALGMQAHIQSPQKLAGLLRDRFPNPAERKAWITNNISQYGATNIHETDAELATLVSSPGYVRGTLPKEFEDHVDALFMHENASRPGA